VIPKRAYLTTEPREKTENVRVEVTAGHRLHRRGEFLLQILFFNFKSSVCFPLKIFGWRVYPSMIS
jgi:hypothetical protein